jgi:hypothetical protein
MNAQANQDQFPLYYALRLEMLPAKPLLFHASTYSPQLVE